MDGHRRSPPDIEVLDTAPGSGGSKRLWVIIAACCLLLVAAAVGRVAADDASDPLASSAPSGRASPSEVVVQAGRPASAAPVQPRGLATVELSWLNATTDYNLFIRTNGAVYRVQPQTNRAVRTPVPAVQSSGPVSFVPVAQGVLIHPLDSVPGYLVPDDGPARHSDSGGLLYPGPDHRHVWSETDDSRLSLLEVGGHRRTSTQLEIPARAAAGLLAPDGQGYVLASAQGGLYDLRPTGASRIANGDLIAVGPSRLMAGQCDRTARCRAVVFDRHFEPLEPQPQLPTDLGAATGVISPDGRVAALITGPDQPLRLIDLTTGTERLTDLRLRSSGGSATNQVAFSPDSRWVFVAGADYRVHVIDVDTGAVRALLQHATAVEQVVVRS